MVIDLSNLFELVNFFYWILEFFDLGMLQCCYNIYIDEFGYVYLVGCNVNDGGMLFIDVFIILGIFVFVGVVFNNYVYDVYIKSNLMYVLEIYVGDMIIYDVMDKDEVIELGCQEMLFEFIYNIWFFDNE